MKNTHIFQKSLASLRIAGLLSLCFWASSSAAGTPPGSVPENPVVPDQYSQSPRLQPYSRPGARYETYVSGSVAPEEPVIVDDGGDDELAQAQSVDINSASADELAAVLPGIGPSKAQSIIEWRETHGPFRSVEQLLEVSGIGPKTLENIRPFVRLGDGEVLSSRHDQPVVWPVDGKGVSAQKNKPAVWSGNGEPLSAQQHLPALAAGEAEVVLAVRSIIRRAERDRHQALLAEGEVAH